MNIFVVTKCFQLEFFVYSILIIFIFGMILWVINAIMILKSSNTVVFKYFSLTAILTPSNASNILFISLLLSLYLSISFSKLSISDSIFLIFSEFTSEFFSNSAKSFFCFFILSLILSTILSTNVSMYFELNSSFETSSFSPLTFF